MRRIALVFVLLVACASLRPALAFQEPNAIAASVDRELLARFVAATDDARRGLVQAHPEILEKDFREGINLAGHQLRTQGKSDEAEQHYLAALFLGREYHITATETSARNNLGIIYGDRGELDAAKAQFDALMAIATATNDGSLLLSSYANLGITARRMGNLEEALALQARARALAEERGDRFSLARALNNIGAVERELGHYQRAVELLSQSLSIKEQGAVEPVDIASTLVNLGATYAEQGDYPLAVNYYGRALTFLKNAGAPAYSSIGALANLGQALTATGDYAGAKERLNAAYALAEQARDPRYATSVLYNLSSIARAEHRPDEAESLQRRALAIREQTNNRAGIVESLTELAHLMLLRQRVAEGLPYAERAVALAHESHSPSQEWKAQAALADLLHALGRVDEARSLYQAAIATIDALRLEIAGSERSRQQYLSDRLGPTYGLAKLETEAGHPFEALALIDHARARELVDFIATGTRERAVSTQLTEAQRAEEQRVNSTLIGLAAALDTEARSAKPNSKRLGQLAADLQRARLAREAFLGELYAQQPVLRFARGATPDITRERIADVLTPGLAVVTFMMTEERGWTIIVKAGAREPVVTVREISRSTNDLLELTRTFARQVATRDLAFAGTARTLYDALIGPNDSVLAGATQVVIVPDGPLGNVPFQALRTPRNKFLIEEHAVSYAPSLAALTALQARARTQASAPLSIVAFGDPDTGIPDGSPGAVAASRRGLATGRLPEAAREVRAIGALYGGPRSEVLVAGQATEAAFRARTASASVLHIATHGVLDNENPMYSHLLLAPTPGAVAADHTTDGRLEAWEVLELGVKARLVVLSACQTAGGADFGEGIVGLSWSLFAAGASTAVVSQWEVDSASTTSLMIAFHKQLLSASHPSPAQALRQASLSLLASPEFRHPFYWAGFISVGAN